jgi:hypothetical protein
MTGDTFRVRPREESQNQMIATEKRALSLYVSKACPAYWIVRDHQGQFWMVSPGENSWERRQPFEPTDETELEPIPGHYRYMLDLPF